MGEYRRVGGLTAEDRPVWRMGWMGGDFFYTSYGRWMISPHFLEDSGWILSEERGLTEIPQKGWRWADGKGTWTSDPELTVVGE